MALGILETDAANVNQLNALNTQLQKKINQRMATAIAMIQTVSTPSKPGKCRANVGVGIQNSEAALALGVGCLSENARINYNIGVGAGVNNTGISIQAGLGWDLY